MKKLQHVLALGCGLALCLFMPLNAAAWSGYGHEVVSHLATYHLSPEAKRAVDELLEGETLPDIGSWADQVRNDRPATAPFHYVNGPRDRLVPRESDFSLPEGSVYAAVLGYAEQVVDDSMSRSERAEALKFLVHFIGDLHQPLHAGFGDDRGGNDFPVLLDGEMSNLHRYWDHDILAPYLNDYSAAEFAAILHHGHRDDGNSRSMDPRDWVVEARRYVFAGLYPVPRRDPPVERGEVAVLDDAYRDVWLPVAERQLVRAGRRVAATLNAIFEHGESPFEAPPSPFQ